MRGYGEETNNSKNYKRTVPHPNTHMYVMHVRAHKNQELYIINGRAVSTGPLVLSSPQSKSKIKQRCTLKNKKYNRFASAGFPVLPTSRGASSKKQAIAIRDHRCPRKRSTADSVLLKVRRDSMRAAIPQPRLEVNLNRCSPHLPDVRVSLSAGDRTQKATTLREDRGETLITCQTDTFGAKPRDTHAHEHKKGDYRRLLRENRLRYRHRWFPNIKS